MLTRGARHGLCRLNIIALVHASYMALRVTSSFILLAATTHLACGGYPPRTMAWEGIRAGMLRVHVTVTLPEEAQDTDVHSTADLCLAAGKARGAKILSGIALLERRDAALSDRCFTSFDSFARRGRVSYRSCDEESCRCVIDFDISDSFNAADHAE